MRKNKYGVAAIVVLILLLMLVVPGQVFGERTDERAAEHAGAGLAGEMPLLTWTGAMDLVEAMSMPSFLGAVTGAEFRGVEEQAAVFSQSIQNFPMHGDSFTLISTGWASEAPQPDQGAAFFASTNVTGGQYKANHSPHGYAANDLAELAVTVTVPDDAKTLAFLYKFGTEENPTYLGSVFQDYFRVLANVPEAFVNAYIPLLPDGTVAVYVDNANKFSNSPGGSSGSPLPPYPEPDDTAYNAVTDLMQVYFDVSGYQGMEMTLTIEIADASDGILDSAVFLDGFEFSTEAAPAPPFALVQSLVIGVQSPVSLSLTDSAGRVTGLVDGEVKSEIPGASYNPDTNEVTIIGAYDNYTIRVYGEDTGTYTLYGKYYHEDEGWFKLNLPDQEITAGDTHQFKLNDLDWVLYLARLAGDDRYKTAVAVSEEGWPEGADTVLLARGDNFPDSLAGVSLAYALDAPILLTPSGWLPDATKSEITRLKPEKVIILGGTAAVSEEVEEELEFLVWMLPELEVERISGSDRFETAAKIAERLAEVQGGSADTAIIASGLNFPDALSAAAYGAVKGYPVLLTGKEQLPGSTAAVLDSLGFAKAVIAGGPGVVGNSVRDELQGMNLSVKRVSGDDRFETSVALAEEYLPAEAEQIFIATGISFPDALAGAVLAAKVNSGILLVDGRAHHAAPPETVQQFFTGRDFSLATIFGGSAAVNDQIEAWFEEQLSQ